MTIGEGWAEGSWIDGSWVVGAWAQAAPVKTIGGTSQLEAFTSSAALDVSTPKTIGATSQLEAFASSGELTVVEPALPKTIGGISQLDPFTSSGELQGPTVVATGGGRLVRKRRKGPFTRGLGFGFDGITNVISTQVPEVEVVETVEAVDLEIELAVIAQGIIETQIETAEDEIKLLEPESGLDEQIRLEMLKKDIMDAGKFMDQLLLQIVFLRDIRRKRQEEETLVAILMTQFGKTDITFH